MVLQCLGNTKRYLGDLAGAAEHLTAALRVFREISDQTGQASVLDSLAGVHVDAGRRAEAREAATEALRLARENGHRRIESAALNTLGLVEPDPAAALALHAEALAVATAIGHGTTRIEATIGMAVQHAGLGAAAEAEQLAHEALTMARDADHRMIEGQAQTALAQALLVAGDQEQAIVVAEEALAVHRETGYLLGEARTLRLLGTARRVTDGTADPYWPQALSLFTRIGTTEADDLRRITVAD
jgi:tetratricopeptide (TPR) repeat protein